jgi:NADH dehydrogenase (ubiquinone) 1 beta subcomplex subunit 3
MYATRILRAAQNGKPNITGFDIRKFGKAAHGARYDPWEQNEAWRYTGQFSRFNRFKNAFPGLGIASVAFAGYCAYEYLFIKDEHHHAEEHGEEHH